jgi:hypothetical protein
MKKARVIAFYLPQYHPMEINNKWWGKGYTEWVNVAKARPLFMGHYQPKIPADLGFYDLRLPETREEQARLAKEAGIEGFCYWHYWLDKDTKLLDRPFKEVLESGSPDYPFCLAWANHNWNNEQWTKAKAFHKAKNILVQKYNKEDYVAHFYDVLPAFKDKRYIKVDGKPLFAVYAPFAIPDPEYFIDTWQKLAKENGLEGIHFVGVTQNLQSVKEEKGKIKGLSYVQTDEPAGPRYQQVLNIGFDAVNSRGQYRAELIESGHIRKYFHTVLRRLFNINFVKVFDYSRITKHLFVEEDKWETVYPTLLPNWDRSPRSGKEANIYHKSTPDRFYEHILNALDIIKNKKNEHRILFLMSWNEWGEGNYVEPDQRYGHGYLDALKKALLE